jgi:drug/metabolite transporter (DMT)-like permease
METGGLIGIVLGLGSAAFYGTSDFFGGLASRRTRTVSVLVTSGIIGVITYLSLALLTGDRLPSAGAALLSVVAGCLSVAVGNVFYYALAHGRMSIVAPVAAVITTSFPVVFSLMREGLPEFLTLVGFALALVAVFLVSSPERIGRVEWRALALPVLAGVMAGFMFILIGTTTTESTYVPLLIMRITSVAGNLVIARRLGAPSIVPREHFPLVLLTGLTSAAATICFVLTAQVGRLDIASVLSALAPAVTVVMAALLLSERVYRPQIIGIVLGTGAIILISV